MVVLFNRILMPYFFSLYIYLFISFVDGKLFNPDIMVVHVRDLNFVLQSEIYLHGDGQL